MLSVKTENLQKGIDVLNAFVTELNAADIEDRIKLSTNTVKFIDERLLSISGDLRNVEGIWKIIRGITNLWILKVNPLSRLKVRPAFQIHKNLLINRQL